MSLAARRSRLETAWSLDDEVVLVGAGDLLSIPGGADQVYPFRAHPDYFWLTDRARPGSVLAFDPQDGWTDFVPRVSEEELVWLGGDDAEGTAKSELPAWLDARAGRPTALLGVAPDGIRGDDALAARLAAILFHTRRKKDDAEIARLRRAAAATAAGFALAAKTIRPGVTERALQIELEAEFFRHGGDRTGYDTIVGGGPNSAVLHFAPTERAFVDGELVLIDAGAEVDGYTADVTRTYPAGGAFTAEQRALYDIVLDTEERAIAACVAGAEYRDIHLRAALDLARGLVDFGVLKGAPESLLEQDAHALFFPHGIGHMVGLGVRDASGYLEGRERSDRPGLRNLRTDLPLEPGYVVTIEPGVYFIPALLTNPKQRERHGGAVDWDRVDGLLDFGGIRIEDDVLVTDSTPENLTAAIPK